MNQIHQIQLVPTSESVPHFLLMGEVTQAICKEAISWILESNLESEEDRQEKLTLYICSPGGDCSAAFALIDVLRASIIPVETIAIGEIGSAGTMIFMAGFPGLRTLTQNTSVMTHNFNAEAGGAHHELVARMVDFELTNKKIVRHFKICTGLTEKVIKEKLITTQDIYLTPAEALKYKICDKISDLT